MADQLARFGAAPAWVRLLIFAGIGAVAALGQAPFNLWFATVIALGVVLTLHRFAIGPRPAALQLWAFGAGYFAISLRWIVEPFLVDVARHGWMAPFALLLMATGAGFFWGLAGWVAQRLAPRSAFMLALMLVVVEMLRSLILTGFPWALLGHVWLETGVAQLAAFGGPHLLTLLTVAAGWAIASLAGQSRAPAIALLGVLAAAGWALQPGPANTPGDDAPLVRLVQPNAPQNQKWDPAYRDVFFNRLLTLTAQGDPVDLTVWPETAIPYLLNGLDEEFQMLSDAARAAPIVFGIQRLDAERRAYNSLVVLDDAGQVRSVYDKRHLVPFGEYMPGAALLGRMGATGLARNLGLGFTPGATLGPVDIPGIGGAVPLICYEGIFAEEITYGDTRPRLLLLITNDAWFGQAAGPEQHLAQARLRAIEQGLPMVRVANTGISAMIDARGQVTASLPMNVDGALDARLPEALPVTIYARFGDYPVAVLLLLLIAGVYLGQRRDSD